MNFIIDHFWKFILLILIVVSGYFAYGKYEEKEAWKAQVSALRGAFQEIDKNLKAKDEVSVGQYMRFLATVKDMQDRMKRGEFKPQSPTGNKGDDEPSVETGLRWLMDGAMDKGDTGTRTAEMDLMQDAVFANLKICERLGIFNNQRNLELMLDGKFPVIEGGNYSGEKLIVSPRIPVSAARELYRHPGNYILTPETIAIIESQDIDAKLKELAAKFKAAGLLTAEANERVVALFNLGKR